MAPTTSKEDSMRRAVVSLVLVVVLLPFATSYGIERPGTTAYQFLKLNAGVRGVGMGNALVAGATDATAMFWNPSGLGWMETREAVLTHVNLPADINYDLAALAWPAGELGVFGLQFGVLHMDDMEVRTAEQPDGTGELFTASDIQVGASFAKMVTDRFVFGLTGKYVREELAEYISNSMTFDIGLQYQTGFRSMKLGMVLLNYGPDVTFDGTFLDYRQSAGTTGEVEERSFEEARQPVSFKAGVIADIESMAGMEMGGTMSGMVALQFEHPSDNKERVNSGLELLYGPLALRAGYNFNYDADSFTLGFGVRQEISGRAVKFDYAYADMGDMTDTSSFMNQPHRFALAVEF
jgi:hypothetical protein